MVSWRECPRLPQPRHWRRARDDDGRTAATGDTIGTTDVINSSSRLDTAIVKEQHATSLTPSVTAAQQAVLRRYDPTLPSLPAETTHRVHWRAQELPPGGGLVFDLIADIPGEFPFVNHGFGHGQKGAIGFLLVEE